MSDIGVLNVSKRVFSKRGDMRTRFRRDKKMS